MNTPLALPVFKLQAFNLCNQGSYFMANTYQAEASGPVTFKIYDSIGTLIRTSVQSGIQGATIYMALAPSSTGLQTVPSYGYYSIVLEDNCGRKDSIRHNFQPGTGTATPPKYDFTPYINRCSAGATYFVVPYKQIVSAPVSSIKIVSGPSGITYPVSPKYGGAPTTQYYFDSLKAGTYQVHVNYGCSQVYDTTITIATSATATVNGTMTFTAPAATCTNTTVVGAGYTTTSVTSSDINSILANYPFIRVTQAPMAFLQSITHSKNGALPTLPLSLGKYNASILDALQNTNGLDTNSLNVYPIRSFNSVQYLTGNYTFEMYGSCTGNIIKTLSFTVDSLNYVLPELGASAAYVCDNGTDIKLLASPIGGTAPYQYQIKLDTDPDAAYSAMQTNNIFSLPSNTLPGTIYTVKMVDNCGNSYIGKVPVNNFTGQFIVFPSHNCLGGTARILTGFIPGATYTWTKPDGSVVVTNSNIINILSFGPADKGTYTVGINALNGCIVRTANGVIGDSCENGGPLPLKLESFTAAPQNKNVQLEWMIRSEINIDKYVVEFSTDAITFKSIATLPALNSNNYSFVHTTPINGINYYRLRYIDKNGETGISNIIIVNFLKIAGFSVYPNPAKRSVNLTMDNSLINKSASINIFSMEGKLIAKKGISHLSQTEAFDVTGFATGKYIIQLITSSKVINTTFQVIHE